MFELTEKPETESFDLDDTEHPNADQYSCRFCGREYHDARKDCGFEDCPGSSHLTTNLQTIKDRLDEHFEKSDAPVRIGTNKGDMTVRAIGSGWFRAELGDLKASSISPWEAVEEVIEKVRQPRLEINRSVWCQAAGFAK